MQDLITDLNLSHKIKSITLAMTEKVKAESISAQFSS